MSDTRTKLIKALCEIPHSIDDDRIELRFNPRRPGHNALNQLLTALEAQFGNESGANAAADSPAPKTEAVTRTTTTEGKFNV